MIKTQGSDTKLISQMQPYNEAKGLSRLDLAGKQIPPLVTQMADGENGSVMMNEFPAKSFEVMRACSGSLTPIMNVSEYLERLESVGVQETDLPVIQPLFHSRIWERMVPGEGPERLVEVIKQLRAEDGRFHMEGGSWTNTISWVQGYDTVLVPMERASSLFHERITASGIPSCDPRYRNALFHLLTAETSCYRYWARESGRTTAASSAGAEVEIVTADQEPAEEPHVTRQRVLCPGSQRAPALCWLRGLAVRA